MARLLGLSMMKMLQWLAEDESEDDSDDDSTLRPCGAVWQKVSHGQISDPPALDRSSTVDAPLTNSFAALAEEEVLSLLAPLDTRTRTGRSACGCRPCSAGAS